MRALVMGMRSGVIALERPPLRDRLSGSISSFGHMVIAGGGRTDLRNRRPERHRSLRVAPGGGYSGTRIDSLRRGWATVERTHAGYSSRKSRRRFANVRATFTVWAVAAPSVSNGRPRWRVAAISTDGMLKLSDVEVYGRRTGWKARRVACRPSCREGHNYTPRLRGLRLGQRHSPLPW